MLDRGEVQQAFQLPQSQLALLDHNGKVYIWDVEKSQALPIPGLNSTSAIIYLDASADGHYLLTTAQNGDVTLYDRQSATGIWSQNLLANGAYLTQAKLNPDLHYAALLRDGAVFIIDLHAHREPSQVQNLDGYLLELAWSRDGSHLSAWSHEKVYVLRLDEQTGVATRVFETTNPAGSPAFNGDGTRLLTVENSKHALRIWQVWPDLNKLIATAKACCAGRELWHNNEFNLVFWSSPNSTIDCYNLFVTHL